MNTEIIPKKYQIVYADPPWSYRDKANAGKRGAGHKYTTQSNNWLENLPVSQITDENCCLFMWVTFPKLAECWQVIKSWGFTYKTVAFTWVKTNKKSSTLFWGMGNWTRANAEICLLATKGHPKRMNAGVHSVIMDAIDKHSKKPSCTRERIVQLLGDIPRIELFATQKTPGWDALGYDIDGRDIQDSLKKNVDEYNEKI